MAASAIDKFKKGTNNFSTTLSSTIGSGDTTISLASVTNLPTDTGIILVIDRVNSSGVLTPSTREYVKGTISASNLINVVRGVGGSTAQAHTSGAVIEQVVDANTWNDMVDGLLVAHNQDGSLIGSAVRTALNQTAATGAGWTTLGYTINTVTANGNRSYDLVVNGSDTTGVTSVGQRLLLPRTVTAPTYMGGAFNGSSHYFTKVTPTGTLSTVTNNFTIMAHYEPTSYGTQGYICGRADAASNNGLGMYYSTLGQITVIVFNTAQANNRYVTSYQSLPLNKKSHIAASWTSGTVVIYIDGVAVPTFTTTNGTAPTVATTGGDFSIGRMGAAGAYASGYISSVGIFDAVLPAATIKLHMDQALTGSEANCIGAWNLNNAATDASSAANNLTATGGVGYTVRSPFTNDVTGTSVTAGTTNYGIIMKQTFSTNTTYTIQIPEGETLPTTGGIGTVSYSTQKTPYGFPSDKGKWDIEFILRTNTSTASNATFAAMTGQSFVVPVGAWDVGYVAGINVTVVVAMYFNLNNVSQTGLTQSSSDLSMQSVVFGTSGAATNNTMVYIVNPFQLSSASTFTMYSLGTSTTGQLQGGSAPVKYFARNNYL